MPAHKRSMHAALLGFLALPGISSSAPPLCQADTPNGIDCPVQSDPRLDQGVVWQCSDNTPPRLPHATYAPADRIQISADAAELSLREDHYSFSGNVVLSSESEQISAQQISYHQDSQNIDAQGEVLLEQRGLRISADQASYRLDTREGSASPVEYRLPRRSARGDAADITIKASSASLSEVSYSTCPPGNRDWLLSARKLDLDQSQGSGEARDVWLQFKQIPLFYTPYASFPIDDRRKSGFLLPRIGMNSRNGVDISLPYYLNLAPHYDATLTPRLMSERGLMLGTELRYLQPRHRGHLLAEWLPNDREYGVEGERSRGSLGIELDGTPWPRWRYAIDLNYLSDDDYLEDMGESLSSSSVKHVERRADLRYTGQGWQLLARMQEFQTVDETLLAADRPYSRLPQILLTGNIPRGRAGLDLQWRGEYTYFERSNSVRGSRLDLLTRIASPLRRSWGYLDPRLALRYTSYDLIDQSAGTDPTPDRATTTLSLDSGLYFDRETSWFGTALRQTLEPRLFYLHTPYVDQSELPDFDTAEYDFSFANIFRDNRFSGADRIGDANQLTGALTSRLLNPTSGEEMLRASIGQIFYFDDRQVQLNASPQEQNSSAIIAELAARMDNNWQIKLGLQYDPHAEQEKLRKSAVSLRYRQDNRRILNLSYRHTEGVLEQTDLSTRWPINRKLHGVARWNYSLLHDQTLEGFVGLEYESCCWTTRLVTRQYRAGPNRELNSSIYLQLELKGLTSIGDKIDQLLERGILGYDTD